jgi:hypothetical protein
MLRASFSRYLPWLVTAPADFPLVTRPVSAWASAGFAVLFVLGWLVFKQTKPERAASPATTANQATI